jgi:hypothetical protein
MALEDARRKTVLPLMRVGTGREALEDGFESQLARAEKEAGIRSQL